MASPVCCVTEDGAPIPEASGAVRALAPLRFPTRSVKASSTSSGSREVSRNAAGIRRVEPILAADPDVQQQYGMIAVKMAGDSTHWRRSTFAVSARSHGAFEHHARDRCRPARHPSARCFANCPMRWNAPPNSTLSTDRIPTSTHCRCTGVVFSFKDPFDTKDMRTTAGGDARYDMISARDHVLVEQLRNKGAIICAKAVDTEYKWPRGDPGGSAARTTYSISAGLSARAPGRQLGQSIRHDARGLARLELGARRVGQRKPCHVQPGEETRTSCRGPANHNAVALILPHKAMLGFDGGAIVPTSMSTAAACPRSPIAPRCSMHCSRLFDPRDPYTTMPRSSVQCQRLTPVARRCLVRRARSAACAW